MEIRHFRYFVAVAEALGFAKAARNLNISQPALSIRIADLERELGLKLFNRTKRKVELTSAGESLLPRACNVVQALDDALRAARLLSPSQSRRLRIALPLETSRNALSNVVRRLQREQVSIDVIEGSNPEQQQLLAAGDIDVGVLRHPFDERGLWVSTPLAEPLGVMIDAEHPLAKLKKVRLPDLSPYSLVLFERHFAPGLYDELLHSCRAGGYTPPEILHLRGGRMTAALLKTEGAVILIAERLLEWRAETGSKEFVWKPLEDSPVRWWVSAVCRSDEYSGIHRMAVDVIVASLQQHENWTPMARPTAGLLSETASGCIENTDKYAVSINSH
ncbi:LysR family transcriptional regulator [Bradyrhizobium sp. 1.29L]